VAYSSWRSFTALISAMPGPWFRLLTPLLEKGDLTCLARAEGVKKS
jgi:hypothetical protein